MATTLPNHETYQPPPRPATVPAVEPTDPPAPARDDAATKKPKKKP
jgi:hypothetical protein